MIHLELNFLRLLRRLRLHRSGAAERFVLMHLEQLDPLPLGPGWFDSSWELERGLEVQEDVELDAASQVRLEDAMIASALARLRLASARSSRARKPADKAASVAETAVAPVSPVEIKGHGSPRTDNLIEFESLDMAEFRLPPRRGSPSRTDLPELELTLA
jgi:hypothetical protein